MLIRVKFREHIPLAIDLKLHQLEFNIFLGQPILHPMAFLNLCIKLQEYCDNKT